MTQEEFIGPASPEWPAPPFTLIGPGVGGTSGNPPLFPTGTYGAQQPRPLAITDLDQFKTTPVVAGYPVNFRRFYAPVDQVKPALAYILAAAQHSLIISMYGFDDPDLADIIKQKLADENVFVQLTLDKSQAAGAHEKLLLEKENYPASSIAIGTSEHHRIIHMKLFVVDSLFTVAGSTNLSVSGETLQDNEMTVHQDPFVAAEATNRLNHLHAYVAQEKPR